MTSCCFCVMASVSVDVEKILHTRRDKEEGEGDGEEKEKEKGPCYWQPQNHSDSNYARVDLWVKDVQVHRTSPSSSSFQQLRCFS
jgi:hypothetical protein